METARLRSFSAAVVMAALVMVPLSAGPAAAGGDRGILCRTEYATPVFKGTASQRVWIYTIPGGRDMRVTDTRGPLQRMELYGHGAGHTQNGWAMYWNFAFCR